MSRDAGDEPVRLPPVVHMSNADDIMRFVGDLRETNPPDLPIYEAVAARRLTLVVCLNPYSAWPEAIIEKCDRPTIIFLTDLVPRPGRRLCVGPLGWNCTSGLARWAKAGLISVGPEHRQHYEDARDRALTSKRLVIVQTDEKHALAWHYALGCPDTLMVAPATGTRAVRPRVLN